MGSEMCIRDSTCGASRYTMLTGQYGPYGNQSLFARAEKLDSPDASIPPSMPEWFRENGYKTVSVGKVSHHPGGWGGEDWYDHNVLEMPGAWDRQLMPTGRWKHPRGAMHSMIHGEIKPIGSFSENKMEVMQSAEGKDIDYHDGLIGAAGLEQLEGEGPGLVRVHDAVVVEHPQLVQITGGDGVRTPGDHAIRDLLEVVECKILFILFWNDDCFYPSA